MWRGVLRHPALRVALLFACFFSVVAVGQYLFARQKAYLEMQHQLSADAARIAESIGSDWSKIAEFRQADFSIARWYVFADSGQVIDVSGFISGLPSKVSPPVNLLPAGPQTIRNEIGESFRVIGTRLGDAVLLLGARVREGADLSDSRLRSQTDRFVQALNESRDADYVNASRKLDLGVIRGQSRLLVLNP